MCETFLVACCFVFVIVKHSVAHLKFFLIFIITTLCRIWNWRPETPGFASKSRYDTGTGLWSTTTFATVRTNQTNFVCELNINGTDYKRSANNSASGKYTISNKNALLRFYLYISAILSLQTTYKSISFSRFSINLYRIKLECLMLGLKIQFSILFTHN